jgi:hypothetical protein
MSKELIELLREVYLQWLDDADPDECADLLGRVDAALAQPAQAAPNVERDLLDSARKVLHAFGADEWDIGHMCLAGQLARQIDAHLAQPSAQAER